MYDIITFGSATMDIIVSPKKLTSLKYNRDSFNAKKICLDIGSKIDVEEIKLNSGGGGTNTAATFSNQKFKTAFIGAVGNDFFGKDIIKELKELNVNTQFILKINKKTTNSSIVILNQENDRTILSYRGASEFLSKKDIPFKKLKTLFRPRLRAGKATWIYVAPLTGLLANHFKDIVEFAHDNNIKIASNPSIAQLSLENFPEIAKKIDVLILNQEEASFLTKIPYRQEETRVLNELSARPSAKTDFSALVFKKIDQMCPGVVVMTKGAEGVAVSDGKHLYSAKPHPERKVVDTTGAGDSFASGFICDFIRTNGDIEKSIQFGMANSEGCISKGGAKNGLLKKGQKFHRVKVINKGL